jgi:hypothetical protein
MDNGFNECLKRFMEMVEVRLNDPEKLEELDLMIGKLLNELKMEMEEGC